MLLLLLALAQTVRVDATPGHAVNAFDPDNALGSSIDVLSRTDINASQHQNGTKREALTASGAC